MGILKQEAIVSAMIAMGKAMGMSVVAEGIETEQQLQYLQNLNCDIAQGYLFSRPVPESEATQFLTSQFSIACLSLLNLKLDPKALSLF